MNVAVARQNKDKFVLVGFIILRVTTVLLSMTIFLVVLIPYIFSIFVKQINLLIQGLAKVSVEQRGSVCVCKCASVHGVGARCRCRCK